MSKSYIAYTATWSSSSWRLNESYRWNPVREYRSSLYIPFRVLIEKNQVRILEAVPTELDVAKLGR